MLSFDELYAKRADYVYFLCQRFEFDDDQAGVLNNEVWRRVNRQFPQIHGETEERWLCKKIVETHRKLKRHGSETENEAHKAQPQSPESRLAYAVMKLGAEYRWPLILRECAGFNYRDLAEILSIPEGTVRARVGRGRALLRRFQEEVA